MPFQNNRIEKKKLLLIIVVSSVILAGIFALVSQQERRRAQDSGRHYDSPSGETISDPEGKTPENFAGDSQPIYLGFARLYDNGLTKFQVEAVKYGFIRFSEGRPEKIKEVSIYVDTIKQQPFDRDSSDPTRRVLFDVLINRKDKFQATVEYVSIRSAELILRSDGKEVFRSGVIDPQRLGEEDEHSGEDELQPEYPR